MSGLQLYAEQCTLISLSLLSHTHLHGCHNYHTKEYHSDTMLRASRRCSFMNPSDSNWLALLHKTCSCLSVYYDSVVLSFAQSAYSVLVLRIGAKIIEETMCHWTRSPPGQIMTIMQVSLDAFLTYLFFNHRQTWESYLKIVCSLFCGAEITHFTFK